MSGLHAIVCAGCHREVERQVSGGGKDAGRYCSRGCAFSHKGLVASERAALRRMASNARKAARERQAHAARERRAQLIAAKLARVCCDCGAGFEQRTHEGRPEKRCTPCASAVVAAHDAKARRAAKARRRAVERGAKADHIDPLRVFARDGWRCHLCGCRAPKELRGTCDPRAPELDHIVTLAEGGQHTWGNVACACRACNLSKGARSMGQLGLALAA